ncbi:MAG: TIGR04084 family radical SAM/SPASM domain-containing protein [Candidatus Diapherotrites archaeon]|nr:TIGR04084 family radical SAM/SPASM domain-containing protein [Candidatus Diapherotrites archaeon]
MIYHLITTPECNLCCEYCCGKAFDEPESNIKFESVPQKPTYSMDELNSFLARDEDKPVSIIFYGGEPLLNIEFIKKVMDSQSKYKTVKNWLIQTNGILLDKLPKEYVNKFHTILVSIDGGKEITNKNRGEGTWEKVTSNLNLIKTSGFRGEIIARMAIEEPANFYEDIMELINPKETGKNMPQGFKFASIHWQLDANMWHDYKKRDFTKWSIKYNKDISKLADYWVMEIKKGNLLRLYPFIGIINSLLFEKKYYLRCGSGISNFTILPNGKISACPIMSGIKEHYLGDIKTAKPKLLPFKLNIKEPCISCEEFELCGGRCLYSNIRPVWPKKGVIEVCESVKHLIREMKRISPVVEKALKDGKIKKQELEFLKYNCAEIIP